MVYIYALRQLDKVVYVGQSKNVKNRVNAHKRNKNFDSYDILEELEGKEIHEILKIEDSYIELYNPIYNKCLNRSDTYQDFNKFCEESNIDKKGFLSFLKQYRVKPIFANNYSLRDLVLYSNNY